MGHLCWGFRAWRLCWDASVQHCVGACCSLYNNVVHACFLFGCNGVLIFWLCIEIAIEPQSEDFFSQIMMSTTMGRILLIQAWWHYVVVHLLLHWLRLGHLELQFVSPPIQCESSIQNAMNNLRCNSKMARHLDNTIHLARF